MNRPAKKPTTWVQVDAALAHAEVRGAERAIAMARPLGGKLPVRVEQELARAVEILRGEAESYDEAVRDERTERDFRQQVTS